MLVCRLKQDAAHPNARTNPASLRSLIDELVLFGCEFDRRAFGLGLDVGVGHWCPDRVLIGCVSDTLPCQLTVFQPGANRVSTGILRRSTLFCQVRSRRIELVEHIVPTDNGYWVYGRGCTEPGGGIVPAWGYVPNKRSRVVGFGQEEILVPTVAGPRPPSPWTVALATTVLSVATGWCIEEVARRVRGQSR